MSTEQPYEIFGHPSWPKEASRRANAYCLRPQAEFTRASGRGLRRVKNVVQDAKGMCKKEHAAWPSDELPKKIDARMEQVPT